MKAHRSAVPALAVAGVLVATLVALSAGAQERFKWPEHPENLQVLPKDIKPEQLRETMIGFSLALGVNCYHCHVGGPEKQLTEFDFVADAKPAKKTAREMLKMVRAINQDYLTKIEPSGTPLHVSCALCHRGVARPQRLDDALAEVIAKDGVKAAAERYRELREKHYGGAAYDFGEATLNRLGYRLLGEDKFDDAIAVFRLNVEMFPGSGNPYDSLAEAYLKKGDRVRAEAFYQRALELDPTNDNAAEQLQKLRGGGEPPPAGR